MTAYIAGWSSTETPMAVVVGGDASGTITVPADLHLSHVALGDGGVDGEPDYVALAQTMETVSGIGSLAVTFSTATNRYTLDFDADSCSLTFTGSAGENLRRALGFSGDRAAATSHTSDVAPYYLIEQAISARSEYSGPYEPDDLTNESTDDGGRAFSVTRESGELWDDWTQQMEEKEAVFERSADPAAPWTWQAFFEHCRATHPFAVYDAVADANGGVHVYRLRGGSDAFTRDTRQPVEADVDRLWNITIESRDLGALP